MFWNMTIFVADPQAWLGFVGKLSKKITNSHSGRGGQLASILSSITQTRAGLGGQQRAHLYSILLNATRFHGRHQRTWLGFVGK